MHILVISCLTRFSFLVQNLQMQVKLFWEITVFMLSVNTLVGIPTLQNPSPPHPHPHGHPAEFQAKKYCLWTQ